ncbi:DUF4291 domain-containing protein [Amycolatopsis sp. NPDC059027]|uniref:DUF4291 domain-containing protein n=1 Tax=unclassified Amycolatopsis TaxID=2618356 RepID=UPI00366F4487
MNDRIPRRQIRAVHTETTIRVYQAYNAEIADAALDAGTFVAPFKRERMTWIKPSFLWMAYRCGWGSKPGQERVLAVDISRDGFAWALRHAALSHYDPEFHADEQAWRASMKTSPVRLQWDPERDLRHRPLSHRSVQIGLSGEAVDRYVDSWITGITDVTATMHAIQAHLAEGRTADAENLLPAEKPYPLDPRLAASIGISA